jgi:glycerophosphoryl diester phosphodiesterase
MLPLVSSRRVGYGRIGLALGAALAAAALAGAEKPGARPFDLQGHRGGRGLWPENTLAAFSSALSLGVSTLELDCGVTSDGVVVVHHDPMLNADHTRDERGRYLESNGPTLLSLRYEDVRRYDVGRLRPGSADAGRYPEQRPVDGERIPRLADVFALVLKRGNRDVRFNVETKIFPEHAELTLPPEAFAQAVVRVVRDAGMDSRTAIQSFDWRTLKAVRRIAPGIATVALTRQRPGDDTVQLGRTGPSPWLAGLDADDFGGSLPKLVKASGASVWSPHYLDLDAAKVEEAHALGLLVVPWTINETADMERVAGWNVDGIISDRPDRLRAVLQAKGVTLPPPTADR